MKDIIRKHEDRLIFYICLTVAILLLAVSFVLPPTGVIDPSVLKAAAILLGFAALGIVGTLGGWEAIKWLLTRKSNILSDIITE